MCAKQSKKVRSVLNIVKINDSERTTSDLPLHYRPALRITSMVVKTMFNCGMFHICFFAFLWKYFQLSLQIIVEMQSFYAIIALIHVNIHRGPQNG